MRRIDVPLEIEVDHINYEIINPFYQDDIIRAFAGREFDVNFYERESGSVPFSQAIQWIISQIHVNPFIFTDYYYYLGSTAPNNVMEQVLTGINSEVIALAPTGTMPSSGKLYNGDTISLHSTSDPRVMTTAMYMHSLGNMVADNFAMLADGIPGHTWSLDLNRAFFPISAIRGDSFSDSTDPFISANFIFTGGMDTTGNILVNSVHMAFTALPADYYKQFTLYGDLIGVAYTDINASAEGFSGDNPYEINPSAIGGGYGTGTIRPSDLIDDPTAPNIDAISTGLLTIFKPTLAQIQALGDYLWSSAFDIDTLKKLFGDPMEAIIGLSIVPVNPPGAGSKNVKIGDVDTGISMPYIGRQFVEKDLGSITIDPYIGSFMDYSPYTKIQIYLPYIGFRDLSPEDVMGTTLSIKYIIDVVSGGCNAIINVSGKGAIYQFNGSCIANIPLSAINYSGAIQNAVSAIGSGLTTVAGIATGNPAMGALGVAGLVSNAANTAVNSKPTIQHSGTMGGAAGLCSVQYPYCIIERPRLSTPARYNNFIGNTLNVTMTLSDCHGLTIIDNIHLDNVICTDKEREELLRLLKEGVIL